MELKTSEEIISELRFEKYEGKKAIGYDYYKVQKAFKKEAIKEIKHLRSPESHTDFAADCEAFGNGTKHNVIEYIKWKNNLTEEDLK